MYRIDIYKRFNDPSWSEEPECTLFGSIDDIVYLIDFISSNSDLYFRIREQ